MRNRPIITWLSKKILMLLSIAIVVSTGTAFAVVPAAPTLYSPFNNSTINGTLMSFTWNPVENATSYWLQAGIIDKDVGNYTSYIYSPFPDNGTSFGWHVKACNAEGCGNWSETWSFTNGPSAAPATPSLLYPSNNASINGPAIQFQWVPAARAASYTLEMAYDPTFTRTYYTYDVGAATSYTPTYPPHARQRPDLLLARDCQQQQGINQLSLPEFYERAVRFTPYANSLLSR